tara:strand:- start:285 stop:1070 length:786 start_codon:yes stop_codon:yes gene_type:complete
MCFVAVSLGIHPEFPLIIAANRDEYFSRPTEPLARWPGWPTVIAGRDLTGGGTWLGLSQAGRFAALTNCRTDAVSAKPGSLSRGTIVKDFLLGAGDVLSDVESGVLAGRSDYGGFNLIAGTASNVSILSNAAQFHASETSGVFVLSNCPPDVEWPKTQIGAKRFSELLQSQGKGENLESALFGFLANPEPMESAADERDDNPGAQLLERVVFVRGSQYGTRASSVVLVNHNQHAVFFERTFDAQGQLVLESVEYLDFGRST